MKPALDEPVPMRLNIKQLSKIQLSKHSFPQKSLNAHATVRTNLWMHAIARVRVKP